MYRYRYVHVSISCFPKTFYIYIYIYIHACMHTCMHAYVCMYVCMCISKFTHMYVQIESMTYVNDLDLGTLRSQGGNVWGGVRSQFPLKLGDHSKSYPCKIYKGQISSLKYQNMYVFSYI